ncbi:DEAD/DEAH box helicase [Micropruina sonneratiae]|uniref:DEAD/DEAH box helicase n=1 Tax=Micropruina sonneratiae TaxID=2986940 RepID=UPI0022269AC0|nr:DEAD/DEAH box helicase [Micropruina sp. KQZ13P-5]MCW3156483.1 DEAD/DEAH box helicase [Micropruina sp. KQZ13P-5]
MAIPGWIEGREQVRHVHRRPARPGLTAAFPDWVSEPVRQVLAGQGVATLWQHQQLAADAAFAGRHVALSTSTGSGKSLAYLLPIVAATAEGAIGRDCGAHRWSSAARAHTALYLAPTKALAHDQARRVTGLGGASWRVSTLDGDSDAEERRFARDFATFVLTNPDMLHRSVLPGHERWQGLLRSLRYVVVDEAHRYRGVFGAHVANVLRRLRRICRHYGADPVFISASGTIADPAQHLHRLAGVTEVLAVDTDTCSRSALDFVLWQGEEDAHREGAGMLARLVDSGEQALAFTSSRVQAELVAERARRLCLVPDDIASYRAGYLAADRRELEDGLSSGRLRGVACTNALELGVDLTGMDAVLTIGYPGSLAALWQQAGRAGRDGRDALAVLIARPEPLDSWLCDHPEALFDAPIEATVLHHDQPAVLGAHLAAAAQELPVRAADEEFFGDGMTALLERLTAGGVLRRRGAAWYWTAPTRAVDRIDLRSIAGTGVEIIQADTGRVIGQVDAAAADRTVHTGAVYLHQGEQWLVEDYDLDAGVALCRALRAEWFTQALSQASARVVSTDRRRPLGQGSLFAGTIELTSQVTGYLRRDAATGTVWDSTPLELPARTFRTRALWWTLPDACDLDERTLAGGLHAAEHAAIGLLPGFTPCDHGDVGGLSITHHADTGAPTVFVHDGLPGGSGFADQAFELAQPWLAATAQLLARCGCEKGCPRCVVSPRCGSGNTPLDRLAALRVFDALAVTNARPVHGTPATLPA